MESRHDHPYSLSPPADRSLPVPRRAAHPLVGNSRNRGRRDHCPSWRLVCLRRRRHGPPDLQIGLLLQVPTSARSVYVGKTTLEQRGSGGSNISLCHTTTTRHTRANGDNNHSRLVLQTWRLGFYGEPLQGGHLLLLPHHYVFQIHDINLERTRANSGRSRQRGPSSRPRYRRNGVHNYLRH